MGDRVNLTGSIKEQISDQRVKYFISPNKKQMIIFDVQSIRKTKKTASMLDLTPAASTPCMMSSSPRQNNATYDTIIKVNSVHSYALPVFFFVDVERELSTVTEKFKTGDQMEIIF